MCLNDSVSESCYNGSHGENDCADYKYERFHAGHQRKIMQQAMLICDATLGSTGSVNGPSNTAHGNASHVGGANSNSTAAQGGKGGTAAKEEGSATLMQYRKQLPDVRVADEATSKDVLGLLFQLVQMQIRKAEKYREVHISLQLEDTTDLSL